jgi:SAM-dependent methyltransferase
MHAKEPAMTTTFLRESYDEYPRIEQEFQEFLDESLHPRGPDMLYEVVASLRLPPQANVLDLGCGEGRFSIELAEKFRFAVLGIDPVPRHIELADRARAAAAATRTPELSKLVRFQLGAAEALPVADASIDLIWCREMLYHVELERTFAECRRVLRQDGYLLIYHNVATERLDTREVERWQSANAGERSALYSAQQIETAFTGAGLNIDQCLELGSEFGEFAQETRGEPGRRLLHAARLLRSPERYIAQFGQKNYDIMLGDCLWHIYRMIGKLSSRVYLLRRS